MTLPVSVEYLHHGALLFANTAVQIVLLFVGGLLLTAAMRRSAAARHAVWLCTLCGMLLTPFLALLLPAAWLSIGIPAIGSAPARVSVPTENRPGRPAMAAHIAAADAARSAAADAPREAAKRPEIANRSSSSHPRAVERYESPAPPQSRLMAGHDFAAVISPWVSTIERLVLGLWLLGVVFALARLAMGWQMIRRLRTNTRTIDAAIFARVLTGVRERFPAQSLPTIAWSGKLASPAAVGLLKPLVLLPTTLRDMLSAEQLCDVLVHECAHVVRRDHVVGVLQRLAAVLFWPHPLVHFLNRRLAQAREELCDNFVLRDGRATDYAQTLLTLSLKLTTKRRPLLAIGILQPRWNLEDRVRGLLDKQRMLDTTLPLRFRVVLIPACAVLLLLVAGIQLVDAQAATQQLLAVAGPQTVPSNDVPAEDAAIDQWLKQLDQPDQAKRIEAMQRLRQVGPRAAPVIPALVALLADEKLGREARLTLWRIGEPAVPVLIQALQSDDDQVRWWAAQALEEIGPAAKVAIPALIASFEDTRHPVKNAASALAGMGVLALPQVMAILADPSSSPDARVGAAQTIWSIGPRAKDAVPLLIEALKDDRKPPREGFVSVRQAAISALGSIGPGASTAATAIAPFLRDANRYVRSCTVETLGEFGPGAAPAVSALTAVLDDEYKELPARAAEALGRIGPPAESAAPALVNLLLQLDGEVNGARSKMVAAALGQIGAASAPAVLKAYRSADGVDRPRLINALGEIGIQHDEVLNTLISAIGTRDSALRLAALEALNPRFTVLGTNVQAAIPAVIGALTDPDYWVRARAAQALFCLGPMAERAIPSLVKLLDDSEFQVRQEAVWALLSVGPRSDVARQAIESATQDRDRDVRNIAAYTLRLLRSGSPAIKAGDLLRMRMLDLRQARGADSMDESVSVADLVRDFNAENKKLERGLDQPPLTEDEVVAAIQRSQWKPGEHNRSEREFAVFKSVAETRQFPTEAYFAVWTSENPSTFVVNHVWSIQLYLPSLDGDGFDGFPIRHTKLREEKIDPTTVAWGKPDPDGLSLGGYLSPKKGKYALGERVRLLLFVRNEGKRTVPMTFANTTHPMPNDFTVTDEKGVKVEVRKGQNGNWLLPWLSGYMGGELGAGDVHRFEVPYEISFGGDGSNKLVGRVIDARPGQTLQLKIRAHNGTDRTRADDEPKPETGVVTFAVANTADPPPRKRVTPIWSTQSGRLIMSLPNKANDGGLSDD